MIKHRETRMVAAKETKAQRVAREAAEAAFEDAAAQSKAAYAALAELQARLGADHEDTTKALKAYFKADGAMESARRAIPERPTKAVTRVWTEY